MAAQLVRLEQYTISLGQHFLSLNPGICFFFWNWSPQLQPFWDWPFDCECSSPQLAGSHLRIFMIILWQLRPFLSVYRHCSFMVLTVEMLCMQPLQQYCASKPTWAWCWFPSFQRGSWAQVGGSSLFWRGQVDSLCSKDSECQATSGHILVAHCKCWCLIMFQVNTQNVAKFSFPKVHVLTLLLYQLKSLCL